MWISCHKSNPGGEVCIYSKMRTWNSLKKYELRLHVHLILFWIKLTFILPCIYQEIYFFLPEIQIRDVAEPFAQINEDRHLLAILIICESVNSPDEHLVLFSVWINPFGTVICHCKGLFEHLPHTKLDLLLLWSWFCYIKCVLTQRL